jgi:predicted transcriptional regulator
MSETSKKKVGRRPMGKITIGIRVFPETKRALDDAANQRRDRSLSDYAEEAIQARLRKDGYL